jgi:hypothetical protein
MAMLSHITREEIGEFIRRINIYAKWMIKGDPNKRLSQENFSFDEAHKLQQISLLNLGLFNDLAALKAAYPEGSPGILGSYAYVMESNFPVLYFWDNGDKLWFNSEKIDAMGHDEVVTLYGSNPNTEIFSNIYANIVSNLSGTRSLTVTSNGNIGNLKVTAPNVTFTPFVNTTVNFLINWASVPNVSTSVNGVLNSVDADKMLSNTYLETSTTAAYAIPFTTVINATPTNMAALNADVFYFYPWVAS